MNLTPNTTFRCRTRWHPSLHGLPRKFQRAPIATNTFNSPFNSTLARAFSDQLNDAFLIDESLDRLSQTINRKKQSVSYQSSELAALEARIKAAEQLLEEKKKRISVSTGSPSPTSRSRPPIPAFDKPEADNIETKDEPEAADAKSVRTDGGYVVVEKTQPMAHQKTYQARPPPPPPAVPTGI
ncbi:hypothetical protein EDC01DRAFT_647789 [Geopyxis carbonaria]|nr:hypothetical protein EDC01DRAFT_647789 [Geopyxis carbonaria]